MTPPQKPEWMELADADSVPSTKKSSRLLPALIASMALAIVGVGAIANQVTNEAPASATEQLAPIQSNSSPAAAQVTPQAAMAVAAPVTSKANPVAPKQPSIATFPKSGGDDEGDDEGDDRGEHEEREGDDD
jgi:hypothetical protein